ncbi:MAG TPA: hypothetical protein VFV66_00110 [Nonomuraea sp.]|nr:hypothetical protein [Nonomuraea sp.]
MEKQARTIGIGMLVRRKVAASTAVVTAVVGLSLGTAGPAAADELGSWRAYGNTNPITSSSSTWACNGSILVYIPDGGVLAQVCTVRSADKRYVQGAVIVRNNMSRLYYGTVDLRLVNIDGYTLGEWGCPYSGVAAHSWSVCFGRTISRNSPVWATAYINNQYLGQAPVL